MPIHSGQTKSPGTITFMHSGYWFKDVDDKDYTYHYYSEPRAQTRTIKRMYGFSFWGVFVGIMTYTSPGGE